jgi:hypothetical protein
VVIHPHLARHDEQPLAVKLHLMCIGAERRVDALRVGLRREPKLLLPIVSLFPRPSVSIIHAGPV